jgi:hypothetical protein
MAAVGDERHPDLAGVGGDMRAAWRAEQTDAAADAAEQWRHSRRLVDWLAERMHSGDRLAITIANMRFAGLVEEIGADLIGLRCAFGRVDINVAPGVPIVIEINDKALSGGSSANTGRTFREALFARDGVGDMTVGTLHDPEGIDGTLYVGADFLSVVARRGAETAVPLASVVWVSARR